jgi:hypothetical protein
MLVEGSAIDPDVLAARGVRTIKTGRALPTGYSARQRRRAPGWLATVHRPNGKRTTIFRPDAVNPEHPGHKYEQIPRAGGGGNVLDIHPLCREWIGDTNVPVIFVEGTKKADSLISALRASGQSAVVVAIVGVWNWLHNGGQPIEDMADLPLKGRRTTVMFDSDQLVKWQIQLAAKRLAKYLRDTRDAQVYMTYFDHGEDGSKVGVDDYLASGGTLAGIRLLTRRYDPQDFQLIRLKRDERLRAMLADVVGTFWNHEWHGMGDYSARDVFAVAIEEAASSATVHADGLRIEMASRTWARRAKVSSRTLQKALNRLEDAGLGYRDNEGRKPDKPGGFLLRANVNQDGTEQGTQQNVTEVLQGMYACGLHLRAPRLRWSSPGYKPRRGTVKDTRKVRQGVPPPPRPAIKRLGKIRGATVDVLDDAGGSATIDKLCLALNQKRPRDFRRRVLPMLEDARIITVDGEVVSLAEDWIGHLEDQRQLGREREADERARAPPQGEP